MTIGQVFDTKYEKTLHLYMVARTHVIMKASHELLKLDDLPADHPIYEEALNLREASFDDTETYVGETLPQIDWVFERETYHHPNELLETKNMDTMRFCHAKGGGCEVTLRRSPPNYGYVWEIMREDGSWSDPDLLIAWGKSFQQTP